MLIKRKFLRSALNFIIVLPILTSCTSIHIQNAKEVKKEWGFGVTRLSITPENLPTMIHTKGFGVVSGYSSTTLGWQDENVVVISNPDTCQAFFIGQTPEQIKEIQSLLKLSNTDLNHICFTP